MRFTTRECLEAVQKYFRDRKGWPGDSSLATTIKTFEADHGIRGKTDGQLLILDYDQIDVKWDEPYGHVCRGLILDASTFDVIAFGLKKFFNAGETRADTIDWSTAKVYEKLDGSMVQRFYNPHTGHFEYSTRFQLPIDLKVNKVGGFDITWQQLIDKAVENMDGSLQQHQRETLVLEVMSPYNRIVVPHQECHAKIIAGRGHGMFEEYPLRLYPPKQTVQSFSFTSAEECAAFAETLVGTDQEGFVVCDGDFNRVKVKGSSYVQLHRLKDGVNSFGAIVMLAKANDFEEIVTHFPEFKAAFERAAAAIGDMTWHHEKAYEIFKSLESQKDFAIAINDAGLEMTSALFQTRAGKFPTVREAIYAARDSAFIEAVKKRLGPDHALI